MQYQTLVSRGTRRHGFLLIELLIAISIIGLLMAAGAVSLAAAQQSSRDAERAGHGLAIKQALDSYAAANRGFYPVTGSGCASEQAVALSRYIGAKINGAFPTDPRPQAGATACASGNYAYQEAAVLGVSSPYRYRLQVAFEKARPQGEVNYSEPASVGSRTRYWLNGPGK
jgi:prepilin-type N-terminal cleavage/methylation domain-containing protein